MQRKLEQIFAIIPKHPENWMPEDVNKWLSIIGMAEYSQIFDENAIDGYLILDLEEKDIKEELKITKKLHIKKFVKAIKVLKEFAEFVKSKQL